MLLSAKDVVLTTKHYDGFCLWNTRETSSNILNTPFKRNVVLESAQACLRQVKVRQDKPGLDITFSKRDSQRIDTIIRLDLDQSAKEVHLLHATLGQDALQWISR